MSDRKTPEDMTGDWLGKPDEGFRQDPLALAKRAQARPALPKRFYKEAAVEKTDAGFRLVLDGKPARTPARNFLVFPSQALAEQVAAEWQKLETEIDPARMPLTRLANSAIDGVADRRDAVVADIGAYAETDLIAYRAGDPPRLVDAQSAAWDPLVDWAKGTFGARLALGEGVMHVAQPAEAVAALRKAVGEIENPFKLAALHSMTTLTGSLVIALAVIHGHLSDEGAWTAAHVDDTFQASVWGADFEAEERLAARRTEFQAAATMAALA
jgi:chaperone required for assembly of F1-ATPase